MVKIEDLKRINLLRNVPENLLDILANEAQLSIFGKDIQLVTLDEPIDTFYMLIMGQVAISRKLTPEVDVILDYIQSGSSFGTSSLLDGVTASYTAVCQEPCEAITLSGTRMKELFDENHELSYYIMLGVAEQYKRKMDERARMIMKTIDRNPDMKLEIKDVKDLTLVI